MQEKEDEKLKANHSLIGVYSIFFQFVRSVSLGFTSFGYNVPIQKKNKPFFRSLLLPVPVPVPSFLLLFFHSFIWNHQRWYDANFVVYIHRHTHTLPPTGLKLSSFIHILSESNTKLMLTRSSQFADHKHTEIVAMPDSYHKWKEREM